MIIIDKGIKKITGKKFRLVYVKSLIPKEEFVIIIDGTEKSKTWTIHSVQEVDTYEKVLEKIEELGLIMPEEITNLKKVK